MSEYEEYLVTKVRVQTLCSNYEAQGGFIDEIFGGLFLGISYKGKY
jgi:hypothetical protein